MNRTITHKMVRARLNANDGYLKEKIKILGEGALLALISKPGKLRREQIERSHRNIRFIAETWLGKNTENTQQKFYRRRGIAPTIK